MILIRPQMDFKSDSIKLPTTDLHAASSNAQSQAILSSLLRYELKLKSCLNNLCI